MQIKEIEELNRKLVKTFEAACAENNNLIKCGLLFEDAMAMMKQSYPNEYNTLLIQLKGSIGYYNRVDFIDEVWDYLENSKEFIKILSYLIVARSNTRIEEFIKEN